MTTILAHASGGTVRMAGDGLTNVYNRPVAGVTKIWAHDAGRRGAKVLLGIAGTAGLAGVLPAKLTIDDVPLPGQPVQPWAQAIASAITEIAIEHLLIEDGTMDSNVLLGWAGHVWTICHHAAIPHADGIAAIGCGEGLAIGALDALLFTGMEPEPAMVHALEIARARDLNTGGEITLLALGEPVEPGVNVAAWGGGTVRTCP